MKKAKVAIIGTGAYGTVLANVLADNGHDVIMYGIEQTQINDINNNHLNSKFFQDLLINENISATNDFAVAMEKSEIVILSTPTFALDASIDNIIKYGKREMHIINVAKGLDGEALDVLSKRIKNKLADTGVMKSYGAIYGPSVAIEVIMRKPTCVMSCNEDIKIAEYIAELFSNEYFVVKATDDIVGCEIAAALKNTVAIASGMLHGFAGADNAKASLITIGNAEIYNIAKHFGARLETFMNFATLGDLILTASSIKSRNFSLGVQIAERDSAEPVLKSHKNTVEGVASCDLAYKIVKKLKISSPLFEIMYKILYNKGKPSVLINDFFKHAKVV
ncbi:NAD(P)H-dependent glycerol-3-phosphate dehydrogenase [Spiroplasma culicicola]|uniref:Glycerol-3-phosphate dehydrogenase [NAD(P)+] n=1 Tax=Spiroplasma culicicola AES-1 TaxID=1276246 RepID=W6A6N9_9MOLU|nr:NAD(P)H-dependent glycerol-3-phosphate dehydrogenase [Spiroplasma culicicola]AHI52662.1 NAD(P)H-dependent glycerol-3-phosphate dehydrogenase [Spiroplasma culicicola AES-1]